MLLRGGWAGRGGVGQGVARCSMAQRGGAGARSISWHSKRNSCISVSICQYCMKRGFPSVLRASYGNIPQSGQWGAGGGVMRCMLQFVASGQCVLQSPSHFTFPSPILLCCASHLPHLQGEFVEELRGHTKSVWALTVLADSRLASASEDKTIRIWASGEAHTLLRTACHFHTAKASCAQ